MENIGSLGNIGSAGGFADATSNVGGAFSSGEDNVSLGESIMSGLAIGMVNSQEDHIGEKADITIEKGQMVVYDYDGDGEFDFYDFIDLMDKYSSEAEENSEKEGAKDEKGKN